MAKPKTLTEPKVVDAEGFLIRGGDTVRLPDGREERVTGIQSQDHIHVVGSVVSGSEVSWVSRRAQGACPEVCPIPWGMSSPSWIVPGTGARVRIPPW